MGRLRGPRVGSLILFVRPNLVADTSSLGLLLLSLLLLRESVRLEFFHLY